MNKHCLPVQHVKLQNTLKPYREYHLFQFWVLKLESAHFTCLLIEHIYLLHEENDPRVALPGAHCTDFKHVPTSKCSGGKYGETCKYKQKENFVQNHCLDYWFLKCLHEWEEDGDPMDRGSSMPAKGAPSSSAAQLPGGTKCRTATEPGRARPAGCVLALSSPQLLLLAPLTCMCVLHDYRRSNQSAPRNLSNSRVPRKGS